MFAKPIKSADSAYTILARQNKLRLPRLGVIVSKKNIPKAVQRTRLKRIVRESFRIHSRTIGNLDVVVICQKNCSHKLNAQLFRQLDRHWKYLSNHAD